MKILVIGSGAREHTLAWKLAQSPKVKEMYAAPGNAGMAKVAQILDIKADDNEGLLKFARDNRIDLTVVGPEQPLANGIVDLFMKNGLAIFGPNQKAAEIESSKVFATELMEKHGIPCPYSATFTDFEKASEYLKLQKPPFVIKADGLAAGKGVIIDLSLEEAQKSLTSIMQNKTFGKAGDSVVIQEHLEGREMSFFVFTDGKTVAPTVPACDYKRIFDWNKGPNTGGMGSYSPPEFYNKVLGDIIMKTIMEPVILGMADEGRYYKGALYGGLMITNKVPRVIEFNARLGDPEAQVVLPRLKTDLVDIMLAVVENRLDQINIEFDNNACVGVVMASGGYPGSYKTGFPVNGLDDVDKDIMVFHAGTRTSPEGLVLTSGGRVLTVAATGKNLAEARKKVYSNITRINFEDCYYRKDIALVK
ncbi:MAG: phosphoribosylamine--glycine ligase [Dehalococcoidales bacterium]|nr:phosphoribosylamine--glycine ligase [Dehalococcoidales bacterium]